MPQWINRTVLSGSSVDRNGTNSHTCTFTPAANGNFLIAVITGGVTSTTPSGWTLVQSAVNFAGLYIFSKTAGAGESSLSTTHNASDYPLQGVVYEFYTGTSTVGTPGTATGAGSSGTYNGPACTGLSGTYTRFAVRSWNLGTGSGHSASCVWSLPTTEDYDAYTSGTTGQSYDGIHLTIAYDDNSTGSSFTPSSFLTDNNDSTGEAISFALSVADAPTLQPLPWLQFD